jgi:hypothetical protein
MTAIIDGICKNFSPRYADFLRRMMADPHGCTLEGFDRSELPEFLRRYENPMQRWPVIVSQERHAQFGAIASGLVSLLRRAPRLAFGGDVDALRRYFRLGGEFPLGQIMGAHDGLEYCISRADFVLTEDGPKLLEFNMGPGIGGWQINMFERLYRSDPQINWIFADPTAPLSTANPVGSLVQHAFATAHRRLASTVSPCDMNLAIAVPPSLKDSAKELIVARRPAVGGNSGIGGRVISFTEDALIDHAGGVVSIDGVPVHAVLALTYSHETWVVDRLFEPFRQGDIILLNGPAAVLLGDKSAVALISEMGESGLLDPADHALVKKAVPWTRRLAGGASCTWRGHCADLGETVLDNREQMVLKPANGTNGNGVLIGRHTDAAAWRAAVVRAIASDDHVVQEYCPSQLIYAAMDGQAQPHGFVWSAFVFGDAFSGSYVRMMPSSDSTGVINCYRGASEAIVFQHD